MCKYVETKTRLSVSSLFLLSGLLLIAFVTQGCGHFTRIFIENIQAGRQTDDRILVAVTVENGGNVPWEQERVHDDTPYCVSVKWYNKEDKKEVASAKGCKSDTLSVNGKTTFSLTSDKPVSKTDGLMMSVFVIVHDEEHVIKDKEALDKINSHGYDKPNQKEVESP